MKTATVQEVLGVRRWDGGQHGPVFYHQIRLDNGDFGSIGKKQENAIKAGDTLNYEIDGDRIKEVLQNNFRGNGKSAGSPSSFALSYSKDLMCAMVAAGKTQDLKAHEIADAALVVAVKFHNWLKENQ